MSRFSQTLDGIARELERRKDPRSHARARELRRRAARERPGRPRARGARLQPRIHQLLGFVATAASAGALGLLLLGAFPQGTSPSSVTSDRTHEQKLSARNAQACANAHRALSVWQSSATAFGSSATYSDLSRAATATATDVRRAAQQAGGIALTAELAEVSETFQVAAERLMGDDPNVASSIISEDGPKAVAAVLDRCTGAA